MGEEKAEILAMKQVTLVSLVRRFIEREIWAGRIEVDQKVKELVIARDLSVSRGPVREACNQLTEAGWLISVPQRGSFVRRISYQEAMDIYEVRLALAGTVAGSAAERASDAQIAGMQSLVPKMWAANATVDIDGMNEFTQAFHKALVETSGNETLSKTYLSLLSAHRLFRIGAMQKLGDFNAQVKENNSEAIVAREELIETLARRDSEAAGNLYVRYIEDSRRRSLERYSEAFLSEQGRTA